MARQRPRKPRKNRLRDLLDYLVVWPSLNCVSEPDWPEQTPDAAVADITKHGEDAMCFFAGDWHQANEFQRIDALCRLPYEVCWFEFSIREDGEAIFLYALCVECENQIIAYIVDHIEGRWMLMAAGRIPIRNFENAEYFGLDGYFESLVQGLGGFLTALNCRNTQRLVHQPKSKRQRARARQGKPPLFSYWTLRLTTQDDQDHPMGGTHTSPRVHLRRGHPRQYAPGQWTWVQPHAVGSPARGMVHKDYDGRPLSDART